MTKTKTPVTIRLNSVAVWYYLTRKNLAQNELARRLGITSGYMAQLIGGSRSPSPALRRRMLSALSPISFDELFVISNTEDHRQP